MARPNSRNTLRPAKVRIPPRLGQNRDKPSDNQAAPMTQRNKETPTEPVAAKIPEGVEKTEQFF